MTQKTTGSTPRLLPFDEADAILNGALLRHLGRYDNVLLFDGDLTVDGDFLTAIRSMTDAEPDVVAISGNLTVHGEIALYEPTPCLYVGGFTRAETLVGGDGGIHIHDGAFTHLVYGSHSVGVLRAGEIDVPWVIDYGHDLQMWAPNALYIDNSWVLNAPHDLQAWPPNGRRIDGHGKGYDFDRSLIAEAFVAEVVEPVSAEHYKISVGLFLERLRAGLPVLRPGARARAQIVLDSMEAANSAGASIEELNLSGLRLRQFPKAGAGFAALKKLNLSHNLFDCIPGSVCALTNLEELSLHNALGLVSSPLPDLSPLRRLRKLCLGGWRTGGPSLPSHDLLRPLFAMDLANLEDLSISNWSADDRSGRGPLTADIIAGVGSFKKLRTLDLSCNGLTSLPDDLCTLPELEIINLRGNRLAAATRQRLAETFPQSEIIY